MFLRTAGAMLSLSKTIIAFNEGFAVTFHNTGPTYRDRVAIYPRSVDPASGVAPALWLYTSGMQRVDVTQLPRSEGVLPFGSAEAGAWPLAPGDYNVWFLYNDGHTPIPTQPHSQPIAFTVTTTAGVLSLGGLARACSRHSSATGDRQSMVFPIRAGRPKPECFTSLRALLVQTRRATDQMGKGPTEPHAGRSTFLLSSGGAGGGYY